MSKKSVFGRSGTVSDATAYDASYREGGYQGVFDLPYRHSCYFPLFKEVVKELKNRGMRQVLEVGCGTGALGEIILNTKAIIDYHGFDFSEVGVEKAIARTGRPDAFSVADAMSPSSYAHEYDAIVCTEVLEHVEQDLELLGAWEENSLCICSVPNYDSKNHVRYFESESEVYARFGAHIEIEKIVRIKKPFLVDISWVNYFRVLRSNRYRPAELFKILGFGRFETVGGWFLFVGRKRSIGA